MTGAQHDAAHNKIVLPAVGRKKAKLVQQELLTRARRHMAGNYPEPHADKARSTRYRALLRKIKAQ